MAKANSPDGDVLLTDAEESALYASYAEKIPDGDAVIAVTSAAITAAVRFLGKPAAGVSEEEHELRLRAVIERASCLLYRSLFIRERTYGKVNGRNLTANEIKYFFGGGTLPAFPKE